jgi:HEAT repeats
MCADLEKFPGAFPGTIKAPLDIPSLTKRADVGCQGEVTSVYDEGEVQYLVGNEPTPFERRRAVFHVDRVYKGKIPASSIEIEFLQTSFPSSLERLYQGEYVLIFLISKNTGYQFVNLTTSKMPISREPLSSVEGRASPLIRIRKALIQSLADPNRDVVLVAIEQLAQLKSRETVEALRPLVASQDPAISRAATAVLLKFGKLI